MKEEVLDEDNALESKTTQDRYLCYMMENTHLII